ncbi:MAG: type II toxin-antitoxin system RelE/ParE family toxin [Proteobacteria bacterium]|nr:type II toxin-antitoxin system RelE/ParE family toxin [Pseudomonadota bacterium]MBU2226700.1 type II toxin-antitoxin system RelE/ParE family toxin [Pseudomonadota bacterium]MBU2261257.1 type II toxin-antitoxin system RelE/ParE family toxin [Pseudomonadota bacterium]
MKRTLIIRPEAELDIREAFSWYETQMPGLGANFLLHVDAALRSLQRNPLQYPVIHRESRRCLVRRFPYGVYYVVEDKRIVVVAVFHAKRDPRSWQERS